MEHRQLEYFVTLIDEGSFGRAAAILYVSQPALSQQIQRLEETIGTDLIDRSVRPFTTTAAGSLVYIEARKVLDTLREIMRISNDAQEGNIGRIRVGIAPSLLHGPLPSALLSFQETYPDVNLIIERGITEDLRKDFIQQRLDAVLLFSHTQRPNTKNLTLYRLPFVVALPRHHRLVDSQYIRFEELQDETFISVPHSEAPENHDAVVAVCMNAGFSPRLLSVSGTYLEHIGFVASGMGVAIVPETTTKYMTTDVVFKPISEPAMSFDISVSWHDTGNPVVDNLVDSLQTEFTNFSFDGAITRPETPEGTQIYG